MPGTLRTFFIYIQTCTSATLRRMFTINWKRITCNEHFITEFLVYQPCQRTYYQRENLQSTVKKAPKERLHNYLSIMLTYNMHVDYKNKVANKCQEFTRIVIKTLKKTP